MLTPQTVYRCVHPGRKPDFFVNLVLTVHTLPDTLYGVNSVCTLARRDLESCRTRELIINGDGSTFAYPMYSKWIKEYERADPGAHFT